MLCLEAAQTLRAICASNTGVAILNAFGMELAAGVETYKQLCQAAIATTVGTAYTVPASTQAFIKSLHIANNSATAVTGIQLFIGGTVAANAICAPFTLGPNCSVVFNEEGWQFLDATQAEKAYAN